MEVQPDDVAFIVDWGGLATPVGVVLLYVLSSGDGSLRPGGGVLESMDEILGNLPGRAPGSGRSVVERNRVHMVAMGKEEGG